MASLRPHRQRLLVRGDRLFEIVGAVAADAVLVSACQIHSSFVPTRRAGSSGSSPVSACWYAVDRLFKIVSAVAADAVLVSGWPDYPSRLCPLDGHGSCGVLTVQRLAGTR
jgi:hypothetical protein